MSQLKAFKKIHEVPYSSLPYSGEHESVHNVTNKRAWGNKGKTFLRALARSNGFKLVSINRNPSGDITRGYVSCFLTNEDESRFVYIYISDSGLTPAILYRGAKHAKDYTGMSNNFAYVTEESVIKMVSRIKAYLDGEKELL